MAAEVAALAALGVASVKIFLAFPELGMMASDKVLYETLREGGLNRIITFVHCENGSVVEARIEELIERGHIDLTGFVEARPPALEAEAVARTITLAGIAEGAVYVAHQSCREALAEIRAAKARGQRVWAEACTHHLMSPTRATREPAGASS